MSSQVDPGEFGRIRDSYMRVAAPLSRRQQSAWLGDWQQALGRLQYLRVVSATIENSVRSLVQIRAVLSTTSFSLDMVRPDLERLWLTTSSGVSEAAHTFLPDEHELDFHFSAVDHDGSYVTGTISVAKKP